MLLGKPSQRFARAEGPFRPLGDVSRRWTHRETGSGASHPVVRTTTLVAWRRDAAPRVRRELSGRRSTMRNGSMIWGQQLTDRLITLYREGQENWEIADALDVFESKVKSMISTPRMGGILEPRPKRKRRGRPRSQWDPQLTAEVIRLRNRGLYYTDICAETGLSLRQLRPLVTELVEDGRPGDRLLAASSQRQRRRP
jgi:transposase